MKRAWVLGLSVAAAAAQVAAAQPAPHPQAEAQALDLAEKAIALKSVQGPGNQTRRSPSSTRTPC